MDKSAGKIPQNLFHDMVSASNINELTQDTQSAHNLRKGLLHKSMNAGMMSNHMTRIKNDFRNNPAHKTPKNALVQTTKKTRNEGINTQISKDFRQFTDYFGIPVEKSKADDKDEIQHHGSNIFSES